MGPRIPQGKRLHAKGWLQADHSLADGGGYMPCDMTDQSAMPAYEVHAWHAQDTW